MTATAPLSEPKLLLSKYLLQSGDQAFSKVEPYSAGLAISLYQDAVESMAWSVAKAVDAKIPKKAAFEDYWQFVEASPKKPENVTGLPLKAKMLDLNQARVAFKHYGMVPAHGEAERFSAYAAEFLEETASLFFHVSFRQISMADLVHCVSVRQAIKDAEKLLSENLIEESINATAVAEFLTTKKFENLIPSVDRSLEDLSELAPRESVRHIRRGLRYVREYLSTLRQWQLQAFAGRDFSEHPKFQRMVPHVMQMANNSFRFQRGPRQSHSLTAADAEFCIRYVTNYAIQAQDRI